MKRCHPKRSSATNRGAPAWAVCLLALPLLWFVGGVTAIAQPGDGASAPGVRSTGYWGLGAPLGEERQEVAVAAVQGLVYVIGGVDANLRTVGTVERYDPSSDAWETLPPLPGPRHHAATAVVDGVLYVFGGFATRAFNAVDSVFAFNAEDGEWVTRSSMPTRRGATAAAALDGRIYVIGGFRGESVAEAARYDPTSDQWETLPPLSVARDHLAAGAIDGKLYAAGGRVNTPAANLGTLEVFDPASNAWSALSPMPTPRSGTAGAVLNGRLLVFGGESATVAFSENEAYDPATNAWSSAAAMPTGRHGIGAAVVEGKVFIAGGGDRAGFATTSVNEIFSNEPPGSTLTADEFVLRITLDHLERLPGDPLRLLAAAAYRGEPRTADLFVGVAFADGSLAFFDSSFALQRSQEFLPALRNIQLTPGFVFSAASIAEVRFSSDDPAGPAIAFAAFTRAGSLDDASIDPGDLLSIAQEDFRITQP